MWLNRYIGLTVERVKLSSLILFTAWNCSLTGCVKRSVIMSCKAEQSFQNTVHCPCWEIKAHCQERALLVIQK